MSAYGRKKFHLRQPVVVDIGCNCRKPKIFSLFSKPKSYNSTTTYSSTTNTTATNYSSSSLWDGQYSSSSIAPPSPPPQRRQQRSSSRKKGSKYKNRVAKESVAIVKETLEPYEEFKDSMLQMIVEKDIYCWDDLNDLLHRFLALNSPHHHPTILRAFADLWNGVFSPPSPLAQVHNYHYY